MAADEPLDDSPPDDVLVMQCDCGGLYLWHLGDEPSATCDACAAEHHELGDEP